MTSHPNAPKGAKYVVLKDLRGTRTPFWCSYNGVDPTRAVNGTLMFKALKWCETPQEAEAFIALSRQMKARGVL